MIEISSWKWNDMKESTLTARRTAKWPLITFAALLGAGAVAYAVAKKRQSSAGKSVDDLLHLCEDQANRLERSLNGRLTIAS